MIINLTENQSYDLTFLEQWQQSTSGNKITFHQELSQVDIDGIETHINEMTWDERDLVNADKEFNREVDAELIEGDIASIRILLEWASEQPSAPQFLKDKKAAQDAKRATRK